MTITVIRNKVLASGNTALVVTTFMPRFTAYFQLYSSHPNGRTVLISESEWSYEEGAITEFNAAVSDSQEAA